MKTATLPLTVLTWNVWFDFRDREMRLGAIVREIETASPGCVALQEMTPGVLPMLLNNDYIRRNYVCNYTQSEQVAPYGTIMLVHQRHGPIQWIDEEISTNLFRRLVGARIFLTNAGVEEAFDVTTVHLESTRGESAKRGQQLQEIFEILRVRNAPHALLCGDFNFDPSEEEEREIDPAVWTDAWTSAGDGRCEGYTEDTSVNIMRAMHSHTTKQVRYDRVILKSESITFQKGETHVMGRQCIDEGRQTWPSDHFGVQCTLVKNKE